MLYSPYARALSALLLTAPLASSQTGLRFTDIAQQTGTVDVSFGRASAMVDLDSDGRLDLVNANAGQTNSYFRQRTDGTFEDASSLWGIAPVVEFEWGVLAADFDNDGDDELYFVNGGEPPPFRDSRPYPNRMLRNDIATTGQLVDVSGGLGAAGDIENSFGTTALDYDRDGMLDVFITNKGHTCKLFRNEGALSFSDATSTAGFTRVGEWRHAGAGDFDADGWPDIGVGIGDGPNALYRNNTDGSFTDLAQQSGAYVLADTFGSVFQDYDNDGDLDIYVALYQKVAMTQSPVFLNRGDGTFFNASPGTGIGAHTDMGHDSGDLDADGFPEIMMGTGNPSFLAADALYMVRPNGSGGLNINDIASSSGFTSSGMSRQHGQALGDYDRDGDIDVYCNNGGPEDLPNTAQGNFFWQNRGNTNAWTALEIEGVFSNRTGVGVSAKATTDDGTEVYRTLQVGRGFSNTADHALHFGIGNDVSVERIELTWPSGITQIVDQPPMAAYTPIVETGALLTDNAVLGGSVTYDVAGAVGQVFELGLSLGTSTTPLDGVNGDFLLDSPYTILPPIPLDASGTGSLTLPIPNLPSLVGLTFHSQAWIHEFGDNGSLSELLSFTIR